ncbi:MAG: hypothetical protein NVSMB14_03340 [Isosphaeraceae bacterium]
MRRFLTVMIGTFFVACPAIFGHAASPTLILPDSVQEDWQLVVTTPNTIDGGPQITTSMSPVADKSVPFVDFDLNYSELPNFASGGMQLQGWSGGKCLSSSSYGTAKLNTVNETITWTQSMSVSNGSIVYGVNNGLSTTWGKFGQAQGLASVSYPTSLTDMSHYSPTVSVQRSGASWEANLVKSFTLTQVRYYANGVLLTTDTTQRTVTLAP